jgi:hypothetical protein
MASLPATIAMVMFAERLVGYSAVLMTPALQQARAAAESLWTHPQALFAA